MFYLFSALFLVIIFHYHRRTFNIYNSSQALLNNYKNSITLNIDGNIISHFGSIKNHEYQISINNDGIKYETIDDFIRSPENGNVILADWLKGKGNIVILTIDEHFAMVFANLSEIFVKKGEKVEKNDIIGKIMLDDNGRKILYFSTIKKYYYILLCRIF